MTPDAEDKKKKVKKAKAEEAEEKVIHKPEATASEIDKVQKKRALKPKVKKAKKRVASGGVGRDIGIDIAKPSRTCEDSHCPYHGSLSVRGQIFDGVVVTTKMNRTAVISREHRRYIPKYERYERRTTKISAHKPDCLDIAVGDTVRIMECRPLSKNVSFVIVGRL